MFRLARLLTALLAFTLLAANSASAIPASLAEKPASGSFGTLEQRVGVDALASSGRIDEKSALLYDFASDFPVAARAAAPSGQFYSVAAQTRLGSSSFPGVSRGAALSRGERKSIADHGGRCVVCANVAAGRNQSPKDSDWPCSTHAAERLDVASRSGVGRHAARPPIAAHIRKHFLGFATSGRPRRLLDLGSVMKLIELIRDLESLDEEDTIYAAEPWNDDSEAIVAREPDAGGLPPKRRERA
jgi:hypothetical protein